MAFSEIVNRGLLISALSGFKTKLSEIFAPLASPALTGTPTAPTAAKGTNSTQVATTAFVTDAVSSEAARADSAIAEKNVLVLTFTGLASLPQTITDERITSDMVVVKSTLSNQVSQLCDWSVTPANGSLIINKKGIYEGVGYGGTDITLYLQRTGSETVHESIIKQEFASSTAGLYYNRIFTQDDDESIFNKDIVSAGRITVFRSGKNISIRIQDVTFKAELAAGGNYRIATLPENARILLMQMSTFVSYGDYHGQLSFTASAGEIQIVPWGTAIPANTTIPFRAPIFNIARDHNDQNLEGYTLVVPETT